MQFLIQRKPLSVHLWLAFVAHVKRRRKLFRRHGDHLGLAECNDLTTPRTSDFAKPEAQRKLLVCRGSASFQGEAIDGDFGSHVVHILAVCAQGSTDMHGVRGIAVGQMMIDLFVVKGGKLDLDQAWQVSAPGV